MSIQPYTPSIAFDPKWHRLTVDSDVDMNDGTEEITSVYPVQNKGLMVRVTTYAVSGRKIKKYDPKTESLAFLPGACVVVEQGKATGYVFRSYIGGKGAAGSFTTVVVKETPEFIEQFNKEQEADKEAPAKEAD